MSTPSHHPVRVIVNLGIRASSVIVATFVFFTGYGFLDATLGLPGFIFLLKSVLDAEIFASRSPGIARASETYNSSFFCHIPTLNKDLNFDVIKPFVSLVREALTLLSANVATRLSCIMKVPMVSSFP